MINLAEWFGYSVLKMLNMMQLSYKFGTGRVKQSLHPFDWKEFLGCTLQDFQISCVMFFLNCKAMHSVRRLDTIELLGNDVS